MMALGGCLVVGVYVVAGFLTSSAPPPAASQGSQSPPEQTTSPPEQTTSPPEQTTSAPETRPMTTVLGLPIPGGSIPFPGTQLPTTPEGILNKVLEIPKRLPSPYAARPIEDLGPCPVLPEATDIETRRTQAPLFEDASECEAAVNPLEVLKGAFLENLEVHIKQVTALSDEKEMEIGDCLWPGMKAHTERSEKETIVDDGPEVDYLRGVLEPLTRHVKRKGIRYRVHFASSSVWNAFATPGGHVVVNRGLFSKCRSEADLAGALAHEIQHVDTRHCLARLQYALTLLNFVRQGEGPEKTCDVINERKAQLIEKLIHLGQMLYSSAQEEEADLRGIDTLIRTGYSPFPMARTWREKATTKVAARTGRKTPVSDGLAGALEGLAEEMGTMAEAALQTHPQAQMRFCLARSAGLKLLEKEPDRRLYVGTRNLEERIPFAQKQY